MKLPSQAECSCFYHFAFFFINEFTHDYIYPSFDKNFTKILQAVSQVHGGQFAAGFTDGFVRLYDIRTPEM